MSAMASQTMNDTPRTMVQLAKADSGPPVYIIQPNRTGMPDMKFIDENVAAQFSAT